MSDAPAWIEAAVEKALGVTTEGTPEGLQYVLIRGLSAMGYAQPSLESWMLIRAALAAFLREVPKGYLIPETEIIGDTIRQHDWLEVAEMPPPKRKEKRP